MFCKESYRRNLLKTLMLLVSIFFVCRQSANAAIFSTGVESVIISGELDHNQISALEELLRNRGDTKYIVFHNSPGGTTIAASKLASIIKRLELVTVIDGYCYSSCAIAFLAGKVRIMANMTTNSISFHGPSNIPSYNGDNLTNSYKKFILTRTGGKFDEHLLNKVLQNRDSNGGAFFFDEISSFGMRREYATYCDVGNHLEFYKCNVILGATMSSVGLITSFDRYIFK